MLKIPLQPMSVRDCAESTPDKNPFAESRESIMKNEVPAGKMGINDQRHLWLTEFNGEIIEGKA
jgi:hypothetical protein